MSADALVGVWTYRSFLNLAEPIDDFEKLRFGQAEMVFEVASSPGTLRGQLAFRSSSPQQDDPRLTLAGSIQTGDPSSFRFQGVGVAGTIADGRVYDYTGYVVPAWPDGKNQRPALVGSVIQAAPHDGHPAGLVASFVAVQRDFPEAHTVIPLPEPVREMLASRHHRLHHMVWHGTRNAWLFLTEEIQEQIKRLGWQPGGREARPASKPGSPIVTNGSGEDFLFMHRQMIQEVDAKMEEIGEEPIRGWTVVPAPGPLVVEPDFSDPDPVLPPPGNPDGFTVPPTWFSSDETTNRRIAHLKTDDHYWSRIRWWDREFKNPQYLSTLTLGELGALLEFSIHNDLHMRWASIPRDPRTGEPIPDGRPDNDIREIWDDPAYDFLGEFYSSHVHPVFWRLHGWIDDRIGDWFEAHEAAHPGQVQRAEVEGVPWFKKGRWVHTDEPWAGMGHDVGAMEKVVAILYGPPPTDEVAARDVGVSATPVRRLTWFSSSQDMA